MNSPFSKPFHSRSLGPENRAPLEQIVIEMGLHYDFSYAQTRQLGRETTKASTLGSGLGLGLGLNKRQNLTVKMEEEEEEEEEV